VVSLEDASLANRHPQLDLVIAEAPTPKGKLRWRSTPSLDALVRASSHRIEAAERRTEGRGG
jgi:hypothetical protein